MVSASFAEIKAILMSVPTAQESWVEVFFSAKLSVEGVMQVLTTMSGDLESPVRVAEAGYLNREIMKLNAERGIADGAEVSGKLVVGLRAVVSPAEQTSVVRSVSGFCQPQFRGQATFARTGHTVANAVRRALCAYLMVKPRPGASVLEVGPDVANWIVSGSYDRWNGGKADSYRGARPILGPRDAVRADWHVLVRLIEKSSSKWGDSIVGRAARLADAETDVFPRVKAQEVEGSSEVILSIDANYDVDFADMPRIMLKVGARAWHGCMLRAKGVSRHTKVTEGNLEVIGMSYRVDYEADRIDFRHPHCAAFGYSHKASQYCLYEEHNGYVWTAEGVHYVYSKGPETTSELLFFNVYRVPSAMHMQEPRYVENPHAGKVKITTVWAVGEEVDGVPTAFQEIELYADSLNFWKVLEKRKGLDYKGDLFTTVTLVRSTNVRFWLNGVPVGAGTKIETRMCEAAAVAVEVMAGSGRLDTNRVFSKAMMEYEACMEKNSWLASLLGSVVDMRMLAGTVVGSLTRKWEEVRGRLADAAVASVAKVKVRVESVEDHIKIEGQDWSNEYSHVEPSWAHRECLCDEIIEVRAAIARSVAVPDALRQYERKLAEQNGCKVCLRAIDEALVVEVESGSSGVSELSSVFDGSDMGESDVSVTTASEVGPERSWRDDSCEVCAERKAMEEFVALETYLDRSLRSELKVDAAKVLHIGRMSDAAVNEFSTSRTKHMVVEVLSNKVVKTYGAKLLDYGAVYVFQTGAVVPTKRKGSAVCVDVPDGLHYTCSRLKVYNGPDLVRAVSFALDYGVVAEQNRALKAIIGVPGAGKTYGMMLELSKIWKDRVGNFLILAVTKASVKAAYRYGRKFGIPEEILRTHLMTVDRYLLHVKSKADMVWVDEFAMVHCGKLNAVFSLAGAIDMRIYGDGRQIPYDAFCAEFKVVHSKFSGLIPEQNIEFLGVTHRCAEDVCAMWLDQYPYFYPCDCCGDVDLKQRDTMEVRYIKSVADIDYESDVRYHTYKQEGKDELKAGLNLRGDMDELRAAEESGLATVHEDQGSTRNKVHTVRLDDIYDKNASPKNPSLYNRECYVLTDTTRHRTSYVYSTASSEVDCIIKRIEISRDPKLRALVRQKQGLGKVTFASLLE